MKIHFLEIDETLTIFGVVSNRRRGFDGKNVIGVNVYDVNSRKEIKHQDVKDVVNIETARGFWDGWIEYANKEGFEIIQTERDYSRPDGRPILTDSDIIGAIKDIADSFFSKGTK